MNEEQHYSASLQPPGERKPSLARTQGGVSSEAYGARPRTKPDAGLQPPKRYEHGSRVPGWNDAVDLTKDPALVPDPATTHVPTELREQIEAKMAQFPDRRSAVIAALHAAQNLHGWCSPEAIEQAACVLQLTPAYLTAIATFYDMLETQPTGKHQVYVCTNISCSLRGGDELYAAMCEAVGDDADFNVRPFECLGACDMAPMLSVDGTYVGPLVPEDATQIVADVKAGKPVLEAKQVNNRPCQDQAITGN